MSISEGVVIRSRDPVVVIAALLEHLATLNAHGRGEAIWVRETHADVLLALNGRKATSDDWDRDYWIGVLLDVLTQKINALVPADALLHGRRFGERRKNEWGWWSEPQRH